MILLPLNGERLRRLAGPGQTHLLLIPSEPATEDEAGTQAFVDELLEALRKPLP